MSKYIKLPGMALFFILGLYSLAFSQETFTITAYYPSPSGSYDELGTNKLAVDISGVAVPTEYAAMQAGDAHIGRSLIVGAGGGSGFAYDEGAITADGTVLIKGSVGIGTTNPQADLQVEGVQTNSASLFGNFAIRNTAGGRLGFGANQTGIVHTWIQAGENADNDRAIALNPQDGDVVIGMTPTVTNSRLQVRGRGTSSATSSLNILNSSSASMLFVRDDGNVGIGTTNPSYQLELSTDSAAKPTSNTWTVSSDRRLKKNIQPLRGALAKMLKLRGITFQWKEPKKQGNMTGTYMGLIGQEVEKVFPEWVGTDRYGYKDLTVTGFEALTIEAIKELKAENDTLKARIRLLETKLAK